MSLADWEATYLVLPRLSCNEKVGDYCFTKESDGCRVSVVFRNQLQLDGNGKLNVDHAAACAEAEYHRTRIEELMLIRNIYQRVTRPVTVKLLHEEPQLLNKEELCQEGIVPRWSVSASFSSAYRAIQVGDSIAESQTYWQKASQGRMSSHAADVLRIEKWLQSSEDDDAYGTSFVHLWTAFNAIWRLGCVALPCPQCHSDCGDFHSMESAVPRLLGSSSTAVMNSVSADMRTISQEHWIHGREENQEDFGSQLSTALNGPERDFPDIVLVALKCAYVFRCQLFHEAPEPTNVVKWAPVFSHLLRQVTTTCLFNLTQL